MDYMQRMNDVFDAIGNQANVHGIVKAKPIIEEITRYVITTPMFRKGKKQHLAFKQELMGIKDPEERLKKAWIYFLSKCTNAPSQLHLAGVVILVIPAINEFLKYIPRTKAE